jgi:type IV fimbrial biogenesis protein FimT
MFSQRAFTILESVVCILVFVVILLFAAPNMTHLQKTQQSQLASFELQNIVGHARSRALNSRRTLSLCGSSDGNNCDNNWSEGGLLFEDTNRDGQLDTEENVIKYTPFALKQASLSWKGFSGKFMRFESIGITSASNGTFTYCELDKNPLYSRQVIVSRGGRARLSKDKNGDGIHEDVSGAAQIKCP